MGIRAGFSRQEVEAVFRQKKAAIRAAIETNLAYLGELCVNEARNLNTYRDQTGNLRSSVGYVIAYNGLVIRSAFGGGVAAGVAEGRQVANGLLSEHPTGWALIVVAGMNYASSVESRGLDVLTSAEQLAAAELPGLLQQLKLDIQAT